MSIPGVSANLFHIQSALHHNKATDLSEPQKEVWKDFLIENESTLNAGKHAHPNNLFISPPQAPVFNLFSFNVCRCSTDDHDMNATPLEAFTEANHIAVNEGDLTTAESLLPDGDSDAIDEMIPGSFLDGNSNPNHELLAGRNYEKYDLRDGYLEETTKDTMSSDVSPTENIVNFAREFLGDDSPMTSEWLSEHLGVSKLISTFPEFASYLNENSDLALNFMKALEEVKSTLADFFNQNTVERASELLSDDTPISDEWLAENIDAAHLIAANPAFAIYLQENIEQAEKFVSLSV
jgi:hypothetical protein